MRHPRVCSASVSTLLRLLVLSWACAALGAAHADVVVSETTELKFADVEKGREIVSRRDEFIDALSAFDIKSRMQVTDRQPTKAEFIEHVARQVQSWSSAERRKVTRVTRSIARTLSSEGLDMRLPGEVFVVKTTGKEEANATYTRSNAIVLPQTTWLKKSDPELEVQLAHELFHISTKSNPKLRSQLFETLGFSRGNDVRKQLPESVDRYRVTNPDAPFYRFYKRISVRGKPVEAVSILVASGEYEGGPFFKYIGKYMMAVEGSGYERRIAYESGRPILRRYDQVRGLYDAVGRDTGYDYHPEEVLAKYFEFLYLGKTGLKDQQIVERMRALYGR